jgi:FkbM family methyltransferase
MKEPNRTIIFTQRYVRIILASLKRKLFARLTDNASQLFTKAGDISSIDVQLFGVCDPVLTQSIQHFNKCGYDNYFFDIGANIGLISCEIGDTFTEVYMFEPNYLCSKILEVNTAITLSKTRFKIYKYGLGSFEKKTQLMVPRHNWGGGYIKDELNSYDSHILLNKDSFTTYNSDNYLKLEIEIRDTSTELRKLFTELSQRKLRNGVIKIDVEGYEPIVIKGIAAAIPPECSCYIIFESLNSDLDVSELLSYFQGRARAYKLASKKLFKKNWPRIVKAFLLLFNDRLSWQLCTNELGDWKGDVVFHVQAQQ